MHATILALTDIAATTLRAAIAHAPGAQGLFRQVITTKIDGEVKPVLVVGNAHADFNDGHVLAILNPDKSLADEIKPGVTCGASVLKAKVRGRCDALIDMFVAGQNTPHPSCVYRSRTPEPARFSVR